MIKKSSYDVVKSRYMTEKSRVMEQLQFNTSNPSVSKCDSPKYTFLVDKRATKPQIARAVEDIYADQKVTVLSVNTITAKPKKRRVRGRAGVTAGFKKAVVTFKAGDQIEDTV